MAYIGLNFKVYSVVHGAAPKYLKIEFAMVDERHSISTRHSVQSLVLPHVKSSGAKTFFIIEETVVNHKYSTKVIATSYQGHFNVKMAKIVKISTFYIY